MAAFPASTLPRSRRDTSTIPLHVSKSFTFSGLSTRAHNSVSSVSSASVGAASLASVLLAFEPKTDCPKSKCVEESRGEADAVDSDNAEGVWLLVAGVE